MWSDLLLVGGVGLLTGSALLAAYGQLRVRRAEDRAARMLEHAQLAAASARAALAEYRGCAARGTAELAALCDHLLDVIGHTDRAVKTGKRGR